jgi:hypothetical protein
MKKELNRLESNREIVKILEELVEKYPDLRFNQILLGFNIIKENDFYKESVVLLDRIKATVEIASEIKKTSK